MGAGRRVGHGQLVSCSESAANTVDESLNPIQAAAPGCFATSAANDVDAVASPAPGEVDVVKINPWQGSKSDALTGLTWGETVSVFRT